MRNPKVDRGETSKELNLTTTDFRPKSNLIMHNHEFSPRLLLNKEEIELLQMLTSNSLKGVYVQEGSFFPRIKEPIQGNIRSQVYGSTVEL